MLVVALAALGSAGWVLVNRSWNYSQLAANFASQANNRLELAEAHDRLAESYDYLARQNYRSARSLILMNTQQSKAIRYRADAAKYQSFAEAYRRAARYPWLGPPPIEQPSK
jgi:hypothetical protein